MKTLNRIFNWLLYLTCLALGSLTIIYCLNRVILAYQSPGWAPVPGQIISSYINVGGKNNGIIYLKAMYRYSINGTDYVGTEVSYGFHGFPFGESREEAESKAARYPAGAVVPVYYKPSSPADSCLETGGDLWGYSFPIGGGMVLNIIGVWGIWRLLKPKKKG